MAISKKMPSVALAKQGSINKQHLQEEKEELKQNETSQPTLVFLRLRLVRPRSSRFDRSQKVNPLW